MPKLKCFGTVAFCYRVPDGVPRNNSHNQYRLIAWAASRAAAVRAINRCGIWYRDSEARVHMSVTGNEQELATPQGPGWVYIAPLYRSNATYVRMPEKPQEAADA